MGVILLLFHAIAHSCSFLSFPPHTRINIVASVSLCLCGSVGGEEHCLQEEEDVRQREGKRENKRHERKRNKVFRGTKLAGSISDKGFSSHYVVI